MMCAAVSDPQSGMSCREDRHVEPNQPHPGRNRRLCHRRPRRPREGEALLAADPTLLNTRWDRTGETALEGAAHTGQTELAEHLLAAGAPLDIFTAAMLGRTEDVIAFLDSDPNLANAGGAHGIPLLVYAGLSGKTELLDLLVARGGGKEGHTGALHAAARKGYVDVARWVLDRGADSAAKDFAGNTPLQKRPSETMGR